MKDTSLKQIICNIYLAVLFVVYPLFQHDHYYNMGENKYLFYLWSTIIFLVLLGIAIITDPDTYNKSKGKNGKKKNRSIKNTKAKAELTSGNLTFKEKLVKIKELFMAWFGPKSIVEKFVWAYLVCAIISFIFGIDHYYGFWGADGWHMGLLIQCLMIACFFAFAKVWKPNMLPVWFAMAGSAVVMILGIVMRFGIDPLGNYEGLEWKYVVSFISTIGQTSWYSSYVCVLFPIGITLLYIEKDKMKLMVALLYTVTSFIAISIADSDSILLGVLGMLAVLFWVVVDSKERPERFFLIASLFTGSFVLMERMKLIFETRYNGWAEDTSVKTSDIKLYMFVFILSLVAFVTFCMFKRIGVLEKIYEKRGLLIIIRNVGYLAAALGLIGIIVYIVLNTKGYFGVTEDMIPNSGSIWFFDDIWGHHRGITWKTCWEVFSDYSIFRKLVGIGPDSLAVITQYSSKYSGLLARIFDDNQVLTCAHNEFYNQFIVYGILGGVSYLAIYISGIISYVRKHIETPIVLIGASCIASYMGHNFFCYQTVICTPFIFVVIGMCEAVLNKSKKN